MTASALAIPDEAKVEPKGTYFVVVQKRVKTIARDDPYHTHARPLIVPVDIQNGDCNAAVAVHRTGEAYTACAHQLAKGNGPVKVVRGSTTVTGFHRNGDEFETYWTEFGGETGAVERRSVESLTRFLTESQPMTAWVPAYAGAAYSSQRPQRIIRAGLSFVVKGTDKKARELAAKLVCVFQGERFFDARAVEAHRRHGKAYSGRPPNEDLEFHILYHGTSSSGAKHASERT